MTAISPTITAAAPAWPAADWNALRAAGLAYVEQYAHDLWTDYNRHDPGVTILELLCYAITDLSQRTSLDMKDLLRSVHDSPADLTASFLTARQALPTSPVTELDYRKLLIDVKNVRNAWLVPRPVTLRARPARETDDERLQYAPDPTLPAPLDPDAAKNVDFDLRGLYDIVVEVDPAFRRDYPNKVGLLLHNVRRRYQTHRNLGEDVVSVTEVVPQYIMFCVDVELAPGAAAKEVYARILRGIENYLAPPIRRYSLAQMRAQLDANGQPLTIDQIFEGPALTNGFIRDEELRASALRTVVHASDLVALMMAVPGVVSVRKLRLNYLRRATAQRGGSEWTVDGDARGQQWSLAIPAGRQPVLVPEMSGVAFYRDIVPVSVNLDAVKQRVEELHQEEERAAQPQTPAEDLPVPLGQPYDLGRYSSVLHDFPANYGVGAAGLPASAPPERQRQARQLQGYLLFFDQLLSNYLGQLMGLRQLFSAKDATPGTYFGQALREDDFPGLTKLLREDDFPDLTEREQHRQNVLQDLLSELEGNADRKQHFLDHLLARFGENFSEYALLMHTLRASKADEQDPPTDQTALLEDQAALLADYANFRPAEGYDYHRPAWQNDNMAGITRRFARLLGLRHFQADIPDEPLGDAADAAWLDNLKEPVFVVEHLLLRPDPAWFSQPGEVLMGLGKLTQEAATDLADFAPADFAETDFAASGAAPDSRWLPVCLEPDGSFCEPLDPYSYRVSVVLPGYGRFANVDLRRYAEKVLRSELPAHVLARVCWVSWEQLRDFATACQRWMQHKKTAACSPNSADPAVLTSSLVALIAQLNGLHTIYPHGVLHNCDNDEEDTPIVLGRTMLGQLNTPASGSPAAPPADL